MDRFTWFVVEVYAGIYMLIGRFVMGLIKARVLGFKVRALGFLNLCI